MAYCGVSEGQGSVTSEQRLIWPTVESLRGKVVLLVKEVVNLVYCGVYEGQGSVTSEGSG